MDPTESLIALNIRISSLLLRWISKVTGSSWMKVILSGKMVRTWDRLKKCLIFLWLISLIPIRFVLSALSTDVSLPLDTISDLASRPSMPWPSSPSPSALSSSCWWSEPLNSHNSSKTGLFSTLHSSCFPATFCQFYFGYFSITIMGPMLIRVSRISRSCTMRWGMCWIVYGPCWLMRVPLEGKRFFWYFCLFDVF